MVQYLFAAFSFKKSIDEGGVNYRQLELIRGWTTNLLVVARQEMEHLGLVANLLTAIGEAPEFQHLDFPISLNQTCIRSSDGKPLSLEPFGPRSSLNFICFEMPQTLSPEQRLALRPFLGDFSTSDFDGIYRTYSAIRNLINTIPEEELFIGPPSAQFLSGGNSVVARGRIYPQKHGPAPAEIYDIRLEPVTDRKSANLVIDQIIEEGEGGTDSSETSHFSRFLKMHQEFITELAFDPNFKPSRMVVTNPIAKDPDSVSESSTNITNPDTIQVYELFGETYRTMVLMLMRYFAHTDETAADLIGLQNTVFFPMMTVAIRPLAEILTLLPAGDPESPLRAGPNFSLPPRVQLLPHREPAWRLILSAIQDLAARAERIRNLSSLTDTLRIRISFIAENFARMAMNFQETMHTRTTL